ncbi:MAG: hypothetical protein IPQ16_14620 [Geobacteraceae bacterium]|nr:hypothetical protein [Geobacteraceae bacterium]
MAEKFHKLDEISAQPLADRLVCPLISECRHFHLCYRPDLSYLRYIIQFCGNQFLLCHEYKDRLAGQAPCSAPSDLMTPSARADTGVDQE